MALCVWLVSGCGDGSRQTRPGDADAAPRSTLSAALEPIHEPDLNGFFDAVRDQVLRQQAHWRSVLERDVASRRERAEAYGQLGMLYLAAERYESAKACLRNARRLDPREFRWGYLLGHLHRTTSRPVEAIADYEQALDIRPDDLAALVWLGNLHLDQGRDREAEALFARALAANPVSASARYGLGRVALGRRAHAEALKHFEEALRIRPEASIVHYSLGLAYRGAGDMDRARFHLDRRGDVEPYPPDPLLEELSALLVTPQQQNDSGMAAYRQERWTEAVEQFRRAVEAEPGNPVYRLNLGAALAGSGKRREAREQFREVLRISPDHAGALLNLGNLLAEDGAVEEAVELYRRAVRADPQSREGHLNLAAELLRIGRLEEAREHFQKVIGIEPLNEQARLGQAMALAWRGRYAEARAELEQAIDLLPGAHRLHHALARILAACPEHDLRDGRRALELARRVQQAENSVDAAETMAMALAELGRFDEAVRWQSSAIAAARRADQHELSSSMQDNLRLYSQGKPCRRPWRRDGP